MCSCFVNRTVVWAVDDNIFHRTLAIASAHIRRCLLAPSCVTSSTSGDSAHTRAFTFFFSCFFAASWWWIHLCLLTLIYYLTSTVGASSAQVRPPSFFFPRSFTSSCWWIRLSLLTLIYSLTSTVRGRSEHVRPFIFFFPRLLLPVGGEFACVCLLSPTLWHPLPEAGMGTPGRSLSQLYDKCYMGKLY